MASDIYSALAASQTPQNLYFKRLLEEGTNSAPIQSWTQGASRMANALLAGMAMRGQGDEEGQKFDTMFGLKPGGPVPAPTADAAQPAVPPIAAALAGRPPASERVYDQNERNPLDLPTGPDRDLMIRAIHGEAGNQSGEGQRAVASVMRNRAANGGYGGDTIPGVIRAPNQFEAVNTPAGQQRMAALPAGSPQYDAIGKTVDQAYAGNDPTNGATNFFAPKAQAALGREVPAWARGPGQDIGDHRFFGAPQTAQADPAALPPNATPTQGTLPGQPQGPQPGARVAPPPPPEVLQRARAMWTSGDPAMKQAAIALMQPYMGVKDQTTPMTPEERAQWKVPEGMSAGINRATGKPEFSPAQTNIAVNSVADPIREGIGKTFDKNRNAALIASREIIPNIHDARATLDQGIISGQFSSPKLLMQKVGAVFGLSNEEAANTETYRSILGKQVLAHVKELGVNPSNTDRDFVREVVGGKGDLEESTMRRLLDLSEKYARMSINNHNADAEKLVSTQPDAYKGVAPIMKVDMPGEYVQAPKRSTSGGQGGGQTTTPSVDDLVKKYGPK